MGIIGNDSLVSVLGTLVRQRWHWQFQVIIVREMYTRARPNRDDHESLAWHTSLPAESRSVPAARDSTRTRLKETPSHASDSDDLGPPRRRPPRPAGWTSSHLASRHVKLPAAGPGPRLGVAIAVWQRLQGDSDRPQHAEFDEFCFCVQFTASNGLLFAALPLIMALNIEFLEFFINTMISVLILISILYFR